MLPMFNFLKKQRKVAISWVLGRIFPLVFTATRVTYMFACVSFPNMSFQVLILLLPIQSPLSISLLKSPKYRHGPVFGGECFCLVSFLPMNFLLSCTRADNACCLLIFKLLLFHQKLSKVSLDGSKK